MDEPAGYLIYLIKQVELGVRRPFEERLARKGISAPAYTALAVLQRRPGITSSELARRSFVRAQTMAETVSALIAAGLVRREKDPTHGRQMLLFITPEGDERVSGLRDEVAGLAEVMTEALDPEERAQLVHHLRACRDALVRLSEAERSVQT